MKPVIDSNFLLEIVNTHNPPVFQANGNENTPALNIDFDKVVIAPSVLKKKDYKIVSIILQYY